MTLVFFHSPGHSCCRTALPLGLCDVPLLSRSGCVLWAVSPCREPAWGTPPMAKVMRKEAWHTQRCDQASGNPLFLSIYPQNQGLPTLLFYALTYTSDFTGGWPPITSLREGVNLQLQLIKIPGRDKSVSTYKLLWRFSSLPERVHPATCDFLQPPNHERHEML